MGRAADATQFSIRAKTKTRLDLFKAQHKEQILTAFKKKRRHVSNDDVINYLLVVMNKRKKGGVE